VEQAAEGTSLGGLPGRDRARHDRGRIAIGGLERNEQVWPELAERGMAAPA